MSYSNNNNRSNGYNQSPREVNNKLSISLSQEDLTNPIIDINKMEKIGNFLAKATDEKGNTSNLTTAQLRKFFGEVKKIQADFANRKGDIILLVPKLAYAVGRDKGNVGLNTFYKLISVLLKEINEDEKRFKQFVQLFEAIVAYHKFNVKEK